MRIGLIVPSSNTVLEPTTARLLARIDGGVGGVSAHFARVGVLRIGLDAQASAQFDVLQFESAARALADARVDVLAWAGTSGSWLGIEHDRAVVECLSSVAGVPATTSTLSLLAACRAFGISRLGIATPYTDDVNVEIARTYAAEGVDVVAADGLGRTDNHSFAQVSDRQVEAQLHRVAADAHGVGVVCTNVVGAELADELEVSLGLPILDSVSATVWNALMLAGHSAAASGLGRLLRSGSLRWRLQQITDTLLDATGADRTTLRIDLPEHELGVDLAAAESRRPGVRSIRWEAGLDQRRLETVMWLAHRRRLLIQPDFTRPPFPPAALRDVYGVSAQMLGPVEMGSQLVAWLSAHSMRERGWSGSDVEAMTVAIEAVRSLLQTTDLALA